LAREGALPTILGIRAQSGPFDAHLGREAFTALGWRWWPHAPSTHSPACGCGRGTTSRIVRVLTEAGIDGVAQAENADVLLRHVAVEQPEAVVVDIRVPPAHSDEGL
jgi:hypothetical protein